MPRRFVDLSIYLENDVISDPVPFGPKIQYHKHENTAAQIASFFPGLKKEDLPDGEGWAVENVKLSHPQRHASRRALSFPFDDEQGRARHHHRRGAARLVLPARREARLPRICADGYVVTAADVEAELTRIGHTLKPLEIVRGQHRARARATASTTMSTSGCGMGYEATMYLLERGVRLTGTDAWSWDAPFVYTAKKYGETRTPS